MARPAVTRVVLPVVLLGFLLATHAAADRAQFGDALSTEQFGPTRTVDVRHYKLDLSFDHPRKEVRGTVSISLSPINDGLVDVELDAGPMEITEVALEQVEGAEKLRFRLSDGKLRVDLPRPYTASETLTLSVKYAARPKAGLYFVGPDEAYPDKPAQVWSQGEAQDNHLWFPSFDYPNDRATSEEIYTVPADWTAVGNGELLEIREDPSAGTRSFHYRMEVPHVTYLISVVAGRFEKYTDDFDGIPVEYLVPIGTGRETAMRSFGPTPDMLEFFSERTGVRYPYARYAQTCAVDFIFGGMENISATTQTAQTLHDAQAAEEFDSWGLVAHEAAHQWFGNLLTCADWSEAWLNEGFATYWENLWREHALGADEFRYRMLEDRDSYLKEDREDYRRAIVEHRYTDPMDLFDSHLYPKGAWVLHMIRGILGDELFWKAMAHYTLTHRERVVETSDLRRSIAEATGVNLEAFFDQWTRHGGHPELRVRREWDRSQQLLTLRFEQVQQIDDLTPLFTLPIVVEVETADGKVRRTLRMQQTSRDLTFRLDAEPSVVRVDPDFRVLMELDLERSLEELVRVLSSDPDPVGRIFAARQLAGESTGERAAAALGRSLSTDPFYGVRIEAARALGKLRGDAALSALAMGQADADARVRAAVAAALGEFRGDAEAARLLRDRSSTEKAYGAYGAAVLALARIEAEGARETALQALERDSFQEKIRRAALEALGELGGEESLATLREWTRYGKPQRARTAAIKALGKPASPAGDRGKTVRHLIDLLDDPQIFVRREAMKSLAELNATEAVERLERAARVETDARLRREARRSVERIGKQKAGGKIEELAAEVERLRRDLRNQSDRIGEIEK